MCRIGSSHQYVFKEKQVVFYATGHKGVEPVACTRMAWSLRSQLKIKECPHTFLCIEHMPQQFLFFPFLVGCTTADSITYLPAKAVGNPQVMLMEISLVTLLGSMLSLYKWQFQGALISLLLNTSISVILRMLSFYAFFM